MLAAARSRGRMGYLSLRSLGLCWPVGVDLGGRRALGIRSFPLRTLGVREQRLVLASRASSSAADLGAGAGGFRRWRAGLSLLPWRRGGMVPAGPGAGLRPRVARKPRPREQREAHKNAGQLSQEHA